MRKAQILFKRVKRSNGSVQAIDGGAFNGSPGEFIQMETDPLFMELALNGDRQQGEFQMKSHVTPLYTEESKNNVTSFAKCVVIDDINGFFSDDKAIWTDEKVKLLLSCLEELRPKVGKSNKLSNQAKMWKVITERFVKIGYEMTSVQIRNKYFSLLRQYKKRKTSNIISTCPYESELDVLMNQPDINSEHSQGACDDDGISAIEDSEDDVTPVANCSVVSETDGNFSDEKAIWTEQKVKLLLSALKELLPKVGKSIQLSNKAKMWAVIRERFIKMGFEMTAVQIKNKYTGLERQYNKMKAHNGLASRKRAPYPYKRELEDLMNHSDIKPDQGQEADDDDVISVAADSEDDVTPGANDYVVSDTDGTFSDEKIIWTEPTVKLLLSDLKELRPKVGKSLQLSNKEKMWRTIRERFLKVGFDITTVQLKNKYINLERQYNKMINDQTGRKKASCPYQSELEDLMNNPEFTSKQVLEDQNCSSPETVLHSDGPSKVIKSSVVSELRKLREEKIDELRKLRIEKVAEVKLLRESREQYYNNRTEYLLRKRQHLERKEEHMKKKEELLVAILKKYSK